MLKYIIWNFLINKHCFHPCQGSLFQRKLLTGSSFNIPFTSAAHKVPVKFYLGVVALELNEPKRNSSLSQTGTRCWFICEKRSSCQPLSSGLDAYRSEAGRFCSTQAESKGLIFLCLLFDGGGTLGSWDERKCRSNLIEGETVSYRQWRWEEKSIAALFNISWSSEPTWFDGSFDRLMGPDGGIINNVSHLKPKCDSWRQSSKCYHAKR